MYFSVSSIIPCYFLELWMYLNVAVRICVYCYFNSCLSFCILQLWSDLQMTLLYPTSKTEPFIHTNFSKLLQCWLHKNHQRKQSNF